MLVIDREFTAYRIVTAMIERFGDRPVDETEIEDAVKLVEAWLEEYEQDP